MSGFVDCLVHETLSVLHVIIIVVSRAFMSFTAYPRVLQFVIFVSFMRKWYERTIIIESIEISSVQVYTVTKLNFNIHEIYMRLRPKKRGRRIRWQITENYILQQSADFLFSFSYTDILHLHHQHVIGKRWRALLLLPPSRPRNRKLNSIKLIFRRNKKKCWM